MSRAPSARSLLAVAAAVSFTAITALGAQAAPVFQYTFPASWNGTGGTGTAVTDQSTAHNDGATRGTPSLSATLPPGAAAGTQSLQTNSGGVLTTATQLLSNANIAAAGGYRYDVAFRWDGTTTTFATQKIIDYAGTESLQLNNISGTNASLEFIFTTQGPPDVSVGPSVPIVANTWYQVTAFFDTHGNAVAGDGTLSGTATLTATNLTNPAAPVTSGPLPETKTTYGDGLNRGIGVGRLAISTTGALVDLNGLIYNPTVTLTAPVPEPTSLSLLALTSATLLHFRRPRTT